MLWILFLGDIISNYSQFAGTHKGEIHQKMQIFLYQIMNNKHKIYYTTDVERYVSN